MVGADRGDSPDFSPDFMPKPPFYFSPLPCLQAVVESWDTHYIYISAGEWHGRLVLSSSPQPYDVSHLVPLIVKGSRLNLLVPTISEDAIYRAELVVLEPDYLVDVTTVAACFETYSPKQSIITKLNGTSGATMPILLGNFASQLLDESLRHPDAPPPYSESVRRFFEENALDFAACTEPLDEFHLQAKSQRDNIRALIQKTLCEHSEFHTSRAILEPTIFAKALGLQGRLDLLQADLRVLVEQKSGKRDFRGGPREPHTVQLQLYAAILHYAGGVPYDNLSAFLLYSKYADGMVQVQPDEEMLRHAIYLRNQLVAQERELSTKAEAVEDFFHFTSADDLRCNPSLTDRFWSFWKRPAIAQVFQSVQDSDEVTQSYFLRMYRFVSQEQYLAHVGDGTPQARSMASLWKLSATEKREQGDLLWPLTLQVEREEDATEVHSLILRPSAPDVLTNSNFRVGDAVVVYAVPADREVSITRTLAFRGSLESVSPEKMRIQLNAPQSCVEAFPQNVDYALEHDHVDTSRTLFRGLFSMLRLPKSRRDLILGLRKPSFEPGRKAAGDYGAFQSLVDGACRSRELYLIVGPPGTGKTSFGMLNIVKENLLHTDKSILLTAYTNRAVDEICQKLLEADIPFLRLGHLASCSPQSRQALISSVVTQMQDLSELKTQLLSTRVIVGTTTTLGSNPQLFSLRTFGLCIVDEASQILEPQLMPLLAAIHDEIPAIERFVLIGDHKQLPAVVIQKASASRVDEPVLQNIGLTDCRHSFFERMLSLYRMVCPSCIYEMTRQGRMHPEVADFASTAFYEGRLLPAGLPHQCISLPTVDDASDRLYRLVSRHRFLFFNVEARSAFTTKTNDTEAQLIARIMMAVWHQHRSLRHPFIPEASLGVIVPYRGQIMRIRHFVNEEIKRLKSEEDRQEAVNQLLDVNIDTVERYQGSQRDVIIYGFTVTTPSQLDFLTAENFHEAGQTIDRKLNVALTRAREQLFVVGNATLLERDGIFSRLITYARSREAFIP